MMKRVGLIFVILAVFMEGAKASQADINTIIQLAGQVRSAAQTTEASDANLTEAKEKLREVVDLLNEQGGNDGNYSSECFQFAFEVYSLSQTSAKATDNAIKACKLIQDLDVAKFLFEKHNLSSSSSTAMDNASSQSGSALKGKLDMLDFAFEQYNTSMSSSAAATRSAHGIGRVPKGRLDCLQNLFSKYNSSLSSAAAMDKAIDGCSR